MNDKKFHSYVINKEITDMTKPLEEDYILYGCHVFHGHTLYTPIFAAQDEATVTQMYENITGTKYERIEPNGTAN